MALANCTDLISSVGSKIFIGGAAPATFDAAGYDAVTWTEIGMVESIGEFGDENEVGSFRPLGSNSACQYMAAQQPTTMDLTLARATADDGQVALLAHRGSKTALPYKIETSQTGTAKKHRYMFMGLCPKAKINVGSGSDVVKLMTSIAITGSIVEAQAEDA